jgi:hypothetical protein
MSLVRPAPGVVFIVVGIVGSRPIARSILDGFAVDLNVDLVGVEADAVSANPSHSSPPNHTGTCCESRPASVNAGRSRSRENRSR